MNTAEIKTKHPLMMDIVKQAISFIIGVVISAFVLGRGIQKINAVDEWKKETAPRIERMDSKGTISFEIFHTQYEKDQHRLDEHLKELDSEIKGLQRHTNFEDTADNRQ